MNILAKLEQKMKPYEENTWFFFWDKSQGLERFSVYAREYPWQSIEDAPVIIDTHSYYDFVIWLDGK